MPNQRRRVLWYVASVVSVAVAYTLLYDWGMTALEGRPRSLLHSFGIVVETFTTTGYGEDAPWGSTGMQALMIAMQLTGVVVIFLTLPLFIAPWVERRFETTVPTAVDLEDHVVLCGLTARGETLIDELESWGREYVVVEPDRDRAASLRDRDIEAIHGEPESIEVLEGAGVGRADAVVADGPDERNASVVLSVREISDTVDVVAFVGDPEMADSLSYAGADRVFSPHRLLGESLANRVTTAVTTELGDTVEIGSDFELAELSVQAGCGIEGASLAESGIRERTGANVIGLWHDGEFDSPPAPGTVLDADTIMLVSGTEAQLESLKELTLAEERERARRRVVIAGHGDVGATISQAIASSRVEVVVVDLEDDPRVDVVGDVTGEETLREAGIEGADTLILALADDTAAMLATLVAREINPDVRILARAEEAESVGKLYRAGADYVLALATVSGRMIASTILDEEVISPVIQIEVVRTPAPALAGQSLAEADVRARTGCTVVAVERDGRVITDVGPDLVVETGDSLVVAGTDESVNRFNAIAH